MMTPSGDEFGLRNTHDVPVGDNHDVLDVDTLDVGLTNADTDHDMNKSNSKYNQDSSERSKKAGTTNLGTDTNNNTSRKSKSGSGRSVSLTEFNAKVNVSNDAGAVTNGDQQEGMEKDVKQKSRHDKFGNRYE